MLVYILGFAGCALVLLFASKLVYRQVMVIAGITRVPPFLISLLLVAFSTSIPELFVGITSATQGVPGFSLGDVLGSNVVNLTFIAGLVILLGRHKISLSQHLGHKQLLLTFAISSLPVLLLLDGILSRTDGILLLISYALYVFATVFTHRGREENLDNKNKGLFRALVLFLVGALFLVGSGEVIVYLGSMLSAHLQITPFVIGLFAIAFSTSLPELTYGVRVALARNPELSLADVVGSSAVNATAILGLVSIIHPIVPASLSTVLFTGFFGMAVFCIFYFTVGIRRVSYLYGALLISLYVVFASFGFLI